MLFLINPLFLISFYCQKPVEQHAAPRTEVIGWDRLESPSVNILLRTKLLSLDPLSWDMDFLLTLWPLLILCSLGNGCCMFGFLIFIIIERNFMYNSLYILTEKSLKHLCSIRAQVPVSFLFLSLPPSPLSLWLILWSVQTRNAHSPVRASKTPSKRCPVHLWAMQALCQGLWFSAQTTEYQPLPLFHFLIVDSRPPGSGPLKDPNQVAPKQGLWYTWHFRQSDSRRSGPIEVGKY